MSSSFTRLTAPFRASTWIVIGVILIFATIVIILTKKLSIKWRHFFIGGHMNRTPILNMWTLVLGNPVCNRRIAKQQFFGTFARTIALCWILLWFVLRNSYQAALYTNLSQRGLTSPYDTIEKIQSSNVKILTTPAGYQLLKHVFNRNR